MKKRSRIIPVVMAACFAVTGLPVCAMEQRANSENDDSYTLKWSDEFDGTELNRDDWNVEMHDPGWVNSEWQAYVDSEDNIKVQDGKLYIYPRKKTVSAGAQNMADGTMLNGTYDATAVTANEWDLQALCEGISLEAGKTYYVSFDASATAPRTIAAGVQKRSDDYATYGQIFPWVTTDIQHFAYSFTMAEDDANAGIFFSMGRTSEDIAAAEITISNAVIYEAPVVPTADNGATINGTFEVTNDNMGTQIYENQKLENVSLEAGHTYRLSFKAFSTANRKIAAGVQQTVDPWGQYGSANFDLTSETKEFALEFTADNSDAAAGVYFNIGKYGDDTPESSITISDAKLIDITSTSVEKTEYTSGRISTQNKQTFTYGRFEVRAKVPQGAGYLPAFWLMANDENIYGQWPRCGEIDCMEVMGQNPNKVYGTIHFGNPHSESQGTHTLSGTSFADDFHTFTCEWEPGKITWYVDGIKYHEENNWYSTTEGQGTLTYPAPFDQPFYVILNLAIGGSWVGNPDETTSFDDNPYIVDYVRVYQKDSYDENVEKPVVEVTLRDPDASGNYVNNGTFANEDLTDDVNWKFLTANGGDATAAITDNKMNITTTDAGTVDYSVQLVQAGLPFQKGATYEVTFDAYADAERTMNVDIKAPDHGYKSYMPTKTVDLTTTGKKYTYTFVMKDDSDANGRLEFNMGAAGSTADIHISNVSIKKIAEPDPNAVEEKTVLADGNYIYNGSFQEGTGRLGYWDVSSPENVTVTNFADGRRLKVTVPEGTDFVTLSQDALAFASGTPYEFSFSAQTDNPTDVRIVIGGKKYKVPVTAGDKKTYTFKVPATTEFTNKDVVIKFEEGSTVYVDDIKMTEQALIKNGNFNAGLSGYEVYVDSSANATYVVDSLQEDNALSLTINNTGDADWKVQVKQNNVKLIEGHQYKLKLKIKSTVDRPVRIIMQGGETLGWPVYSNPDNAVVNVGDTFYEFEDTFTMNEATDVAAFLSICLGAITEGDYTSARQVVVIDDISLVDLTSGDDEEILYEDNEPDPAPEPVIPLPGPGIVDPKPNPGQDPVIQKPINGSDNGNGNVTNNNAPHTGDENPIAAVLGIMLLSALAGAVLVKKIKTRKL